MDGEGARAALVGHEGDEVALTLGETVVVGRLRSLTGDEAEVTRDVMFWRASGKGVPVEDIRSGAAIADGRWVPDLRPSPFLYAVTVPLVDIDEIQWLAA